MTPGLSLSQARRAGSDCLVVQLLCCVEANTRVNLNVCVLCVVETSDGVSFFTLKQAYKWFRSAVALAALLIEYFSVMFQCVCWAWAVVYSGSF